LFHAEGIGPAAGFSSTVDDLAKFASWQFRLLENGGKEIVSSNTLREMHRVHFLDEDWQPAWGLGFSVWRDGEKKFLGHGGSCPGYRSQLLIQPNSQIATIFMTNASGVNSRRFAQQLYNIISLALKEASSDGNAKTLKPEFTKYIGHYSEAPWGGETAVITWEGELATVSLPTNDPVGAISKLKHIEDDTFRRIREDDEMGEEIIFETNSSGKVIRMWQHQNFALKFR
jgi:CubicO group peptidase (beta-lactamase class C family)